MFAVVQVRDCRDSDACSDLYYVFPRGSIFTLARRRSVAHQEKMFVLRHRLSQVQQKIAVQMPCCMEICKVRIVGVELKFY